VIVAEPGTDLTRFPSAKHLASWVGLCPGNFEGLMEQDLIISKVAEQGRDITETVQPAVC
jgi:transposase